MIATAIAVECMHAYQREGQGVAACLAYVGKDLGQASLCFEHVDDGRAAELADLHGVCCHAGAKLVDVTDLQLALGGRGCLNSRGADGWGWGWLHCSGGSGALCCTGGLVLLQQGLRHVMRTWLRDPQNSAP